ncbi:hypothetical protein OXPF_18650 [Oxobacter pfennigii]|uniref:Lipoprotein n=1 Tax=Oxobacter pfennigii TaxID=36849 RepID=A0A0P8YCB4_9CLOT|nr:hypothetical protein [Oxobacter pfennigii]KPU44779.1 hypothetical protein OXPF_18650 [Oxobacter pfennigii]
MKKIVLHVTGIIIILFILSGCSINDGRRVTQPGTAVRSNSLGGICLGDSSNDVMNILGKDYKESMEIDYSGYFREDLIIWTYGKGIVVTFGKDTKKVLNAAAQGSDFQTDLGVKPGDSAKIAFEKYQSKFNQVVSRHTDEPIIGWYDIGDGQLIILDLDKDDDSMINMDVEEDSVIEEIVLAYWEHFD